MGKPYEALGPAERAAEIFQRLDKQTGAPLEEGSAHNLKNLGGIYWKLGRPDEACRAAQRAAEIYERLTKSKVASPVVNQTVEGVFRPQAKRDAPAKVGRNEPCPCGSGKKFKKCCGLLA